jgi:glycosyltransferase involved in cell wall biosynthesis
LSKIKKVCILSLSNISWDSRVLREIDMARQHYQVDVIGYGSWQPPEGVRFFSLARKIVFPPLKYFLLVAGKLNNKCFDRYFWLKPQYRQALKIIEEGEYDLVHANDWDALPIATRGRQRSGCRVLYDAHEFSLGINIDIPFNKIYQSYQQFLFSSYGSYVDRRITVAKGIENSYQEYFEWTFNIVRNSPFYQESQYKPALQDKIHLVHHGGAMPGRFLESFINMMKTVDHRFYLHFYLLPTYRSYLKKLKRLAKNNSHIKFHDPVSPNLLIQELSQYDIGIPLIYVEKKSYINSLPNKFFDYIMAGLMVAVSPLPMMRKYIDDYQIGMYSIDHSPEKLAELLNSLSTNQINSFKKRSLEAAKVLNAGVEMDKLHKIYESLL